MEINDEIKYKKNYDTMYVKIKDKDGKEKMSYHDKIPTDFETLLDYINTFPSKFVEIYDKNTIFVKISKRKSIIIHKTLFDKVCDLSVVSGSYRFENFLTLPINLVYYLICQFR